MGMTRETSLLALSISSNIPLNCDFQYNGCPYRGMLQEVEVHKTSCSYRGDGDLGDKQDNDSGDEDDDNNSDDRQARRFVPRCEKIGNFLVFKYKKNYKN